MLVRGYNYSQREKRILVKLVFLIMFLIAHVLTIVVRIGDYEEVKDRLLIPFLILLLADYVIFDFTINPLTGIIALKTRVGKRFYEGMIAHKNDFDIDD